VGKHINKPPKGPDDGKTGYRKPPKQHQWAKGKSGNPAGRPPGSKGIKTDLKKVLATIQTVSRNGDKVTGTVQYLMLEAMALRGSIGDVKAFAALIPVIIQALGFEDRDINENRLSPGDEALLSRVLERMAAGSAQSKPSPRRRTNGGANAAKKGAAGGNKPPARSRRKPGSGPRDETP
jgi:hypothetical protein